MVEKIVTCIRWKTTEYKLFIIKCIILFDSEITIKCH
jgi:hypothetical protein